MTTRPRIDRRSMATWLMAGAVLASACASSPPKPAAPAQPAPAAAPAKTEVLTVAQILHMNEMGNSLQDIMGAIQESGTVYRLTDTQAAKLRGSGLTATLISFMKLTYTHAVEANPALGKSDDKWTQIDGYWYGGRPFGWPEEWVVGAPRFGERFRSK